MKSASKKILLTIIILILLLGLFPSKIFAANTSILSFASASSVLTATGNVGSTTSTIFLTAGVASTTYTFYWSSTNTGQTVTLGNCTTAAAATTCSLAITVPHSSKGIWKIHNEAAAVASANVLSYTITPLITSLSPSSGISGSAVSIVGTGFAGETVSGKISTATIGTGVVTTGTGGTFGDLTINGTAPGTFVRGVYAVTAVGTTSGTITSATSYTLNSSITLSANTGPSGTIIQVSGADFKASSTVTILLDGSATTTTATSSAAGVLSSTNYTIVAAAGAHTINASDVSGSATAITFTITTTLGINNTSAATLTSKTLTTSQVTSTGSLGQIAVNDGRGTNVGWSLTATATNFTNAGSKTIDVTNLTINPNNATFLVVSGSATGVSISTSSTFTSTVSISSILTASSGNGAGSYTINPALSLIIPVGTYSGLYSATITETIQ